MVNTGGGGGWLNVNKSTHLLTNVYKAYYKIDATEYFKEAHFVQIRYIRDSQEKKSMDNFPGE